MKLRRSTGRYCRSDDDFLGEDHPDTITVIRRVVVLVGNQGRLDEAARMKDVLAARRRILGEDHPDTIVAISNLAITLGDQNQLEEVLTIKQEVPSNRPWLWENLSHFDQRDEQFG